jgi:two-component system, sensor histidine kinase
VIDDDHLVLEATATLLRSWGCRVVAAKSCIEALKKLFEIGQRPDLIVCDYRLPHGRSGIDVIEALRDAFEIPALLVSADTGSPRGNISGTGYSLLHKPVDVEKFRAALIEAAVLQRV